MSNSQESTGSAHYNGTNEAQRNVATPSPQQSGESASHYNDRLSWYNWTKQQQGK